MNILGVIPARYASTRFPGKPLALICGKPMVQKVYEQVMLSKSITMLTVATDDQRIFDAVKAFGGNVVMTASHHPNGTSRCLEATRLVQEQNPNLPFEVIINIQGDEPFIQPMQIELLATLFSNPNVQIGSLVKKIETEEALFSPHVVKVVLDQSNKALYFSRHPIPYVRGQKKHDWIKENMYYKHLGIYAFRKTVLEEVCALPVGKLEKAEKLEQLRWLENGFSIHLKTTDLESVGIDTPEDLLKLTNNPC